jgi:radical SAM family uncharacterized protein/radical SAM-linked protein
LAVLFEHPYAAFLHKVRKPTRYTGGEHGVVRKPAGSVEARICLAFPDVYDIGMSHLGYKILYRILNDHPKIAAERCYAPWLDMQQELRQNQKPLLSLETATVLADFDVVGFSLQFELTYTNVLCMLELGQIPLRSDQRADGDPLILAGGPVATHMEPMAPFFDAAVIGDGEEATTEVVLAWASGKRERLPRQERLARLAHIPGVYVPSLYETQRDPASGFEVVTGTNVEGIPARVSRRIVDLARFPFPDTGPVGGPEAVFDRLSFEVARGCTEGCRFCQAGVIYRPVRERDPVELIETVQRSIVKTGQDEVSLTALSTADVSCISPLVRALSLVTAPERVSLGVASLRAYGLSEDILDEMRKVRAGGLTFAPEAGTQRLRDVINKNVTEEELLETAKRVFSRGFDRMKLYFILGLPTERDEDVEAIANVGQNALSVGRRFGKRPTVTVSASIHVPKPHTPFQWCAQDALEEIQRKQQLLRQAVGRARGVKLRMHDARASVLECVFARGDRRLAPVVERAYRNGARFDSWEDELRMDVWEEALRHHEVDLGQYLGEAAVGARLPWDHIDVGLAPGFLEGEYRRALAGRPSPPCSKPVASVPSPAEAKEGKLVCYKCGVACDLDAMQEARRARLSSLSPLLPVGEVAAAEQPLAAAQPAPERLRPARGGSAARAFRLRYQKKGAAALLGHLDLIRELPRILRRAGLRVAYTSGFHPKADLSFAPALALGIASLDEYLDARLIDAPAPDALISRLNGASIDGLWFVAASALPEGAKRLSKIIECARYVLLLDEAHVSSWGGVTWLEDRIAQFLGSSEAVVVRDTDGERKTIDVRAPVQALALAGPLARAQLDEAGVSGSGVPVEVTLSLNQSGSVRMPELLSALTGDASCPYVCVRTALLSSDGAGPLSDQWAGQPGANASAVSST